MSYTPQFEKEYEGGWEDFPSEDTLITAHALNMYDDTFEHIEEYLSEGGGGASALEDLDDVNITSPTDGQVLKYDAENDEWVNGTGGGGGTNAEWTQTQTNGTKIAEIEIDDVSQDVYDSTWSGTHAEYELVKNSLPDGTKVFFTDDGRVTSLWTGDQTTTGNISLSEGYANFDEIEVVWRANRNVKAYTRYIRINVSDIDTTILYQFADSWFSNPNTYCLFSFHFSASTTISVDDVQSTSEYAPVHILAIRGINY